MSNHRIIIILTALASIAPAPALASSILLLTAGDSANNAMIASTLQAQGDTVTVGPTAGNFTGSGLSGFNEVMLMPGYSSAAFNSPAMPVSGQQALLDFVSAGGALVTGEMLKSRPDYSTSYHILSAAIPVLSNSEISTSNTGISFSSLTSDPVLNAGLPSTFHFSAAPAYYTESYYLPKFGATPLFTTNQWTSSFGGYGTGYGAIGWGYGQGRVLSLSTGSDTTELADPNYAQLVRNASNWATGSSSTMPIPIPSPTPEPTTLAVLGLGVAGLLARGRARRRLGR